MKSESTNLQCPLCRGFFNIYRGDTVRFVCDSNECLEVADPTEAGALRQIELVCRVVFEEKLDAIRRWA